MHVWMTRKMDDAWSRPVNLNERFNLNGGIILPILSSGNKYIFFSCEGNIFWVSESVIELLKQKE